jgi:hypothetical protein
VTNPLNHKILWLRKTEMKIPNNFSKAVKKIGKTHLVQSRSLYMVKSGKGKMHAIIG